jgi:multidrug efflux pump
VNRLLRGFFRLFNAGFAATTHLYSRLMGMLLRVGALVLLVYGGLLYLTYRDFARTPTGFIPTQDMGYVSASVQLPDAASAERTWDVVKRLEKVARQTPGMKHTQAMSGQSFLLGANASNFGSLFLVFDEFANRPEPVTDRFFRWLGQPKLEGWLRTRLGWRKTPSLNSDAITADLRRRFAIAAPEATVAVIGPPSVRGVGRAGGFRLMVEDRGDIGLGTLQGQTENLIEVAGQQPDLVGLTTVFRASVPQLYVDVDRTACLKKEVRLKDLFDTLRIYLGSLYVNDFNRFGRTWQVIVQADARFRDQVEHVRRLKVRNARGAMVSLGSVATITEMTGPLVLTRYNMHTAAPINGSAAPGTSSGTAIALMEELSRRELLQAMSVEWTELAYLELQAGNTAMIIFGFAVIMVFLVLAAQYESWSLPLAVILVVPMCLLSAVTGVRISQSDINIFTQIGFVVLVGLASKNAILIVEFAKMRREAGEDRRQATLDACRLRLRPIVMTSFAFILGVLPLILSQGAGAEMRRILGTTVFSGMIGVTFFGLFLTPVFFFLIDWLSGTPFFSSPRVRMVGSIPFEFLSTASLRRVGRRILAVKPRTPAATPEELVEQK